MTLGKDGEEGCWSLILLGSSLTTSLGAECTEEGWDELGFINYFLKIAERFFCTWRMPAVLES